MNEDRASRYQRLRRRAVIGAAAWTAAFLLGLLATGGARALWMAASAATAAWPLGATLQPAAAVVLFSLGLALVHEAGLFPFAFYAGHALEVRYGLSGRTARGWLTAHVKATGIGTALTVLAALVVWGAASVSPAGWWVLAWGAVSAAAVAGAWLAPILILPLFYRLSPLPGPVTDRLSRLAAQAGVPVLGVFAWRAGEGTTKANAALAGLGRTRRILVSDTLLADYSGEELDAVLAHELAHHVHHDLWRVLALDAAVAWLALWAAARAQAVLAGPLGLAGPADPAGLPLVALVMLVVSAAALPLVNAVSRMHERRADSFALDLTGEPAAFAGAVRRLAAQHLVEEEPAWLTRLFFSTHPPVCERLARARDWGRG